MNATARTKTCEPAQPVAGRRSQGGVEGNAAPKSAKNQAVPTELSRGRNKTGQPPAPPAPIAKRDASRKGRGKDTDSLISDSRAPRPYIGKRDDLEAEGIQITRSIPGGHQCYTVSAATSRRTSTQGAAEPSEGGEEQQTAGQDECHTVVHHRPDKPEAAEMETSRDTPASALDHGTLLRRLAAGDVPPSLGSEELQMLLAAIESAKNGELLEGEQCTEDNLGPDQQQANNVDKRLDAIDSESTDSFDDSFDPSSVGCANTRGDGADTHSAACATAPQHASTAVAVNKQHTLNPVQPEPEHSLSQEHSLSLLSEPNGVDKPLHPTDNYAGGPCLKREDSLKRLRRLSMSRGSQVDRGTCGEEGMPASEGSLLGSFGAAAAGHSIDGYSSVSRPAARGMSAAGSRPGTAHSRAAFSCSSQMDDEDLDVIHELRASQTLTDGEVHIHQFAGALAHHSGSALGAPDGGGSNPAIAATAVPAPHGTSRRYSSAPGGVPGVDNELSPPQSPTVPNAGRNGGEENACTASTRRHTMPASTQQPNGHMRTHRQQQGQQQHVQQEHPNIQQQQAVSRQETDHYLFQSPAMPSASQSPMPASQPSKTHHNAPGTPAMSMTSEKLTSILAFLDDAEQRSVHDATIPAVPAMQTAVPAKTQPPAELCIAAPPSLPPFVPQLQPRSSVWGMEQTDDGCESPASSASIVAASPATSQATSTARRVNAGEALLQRIGLTDPHAGVSATRLAGIPRPSTSHGSIGSVGSFATMATTPAATAGAPSPAVHSAPNVIPGKPAHLAESVYDGVKAKIKRLQDEVRDKEAAVDMLHKVGSS